jgi:alpha-glucosidase (family GH31 glycosyl hydrolase)
MARALVVEYQDDPNTWRIADQHLLGDSLLVAPIYSEENRRRVYLPAGTWTDWWNGARLAGGRWIDVEAGLETLPLYIREGGIIPLGPVMQYTDERPVDEITLRISLFTGNGQTTFALPDLRGRTPVHVGNGVTLGQSAGQETHTLITTEMPMHTHLVSASSTTDNKTTATGSVWGASTSNPYAPQANTTMAPNAFGTAGQSQPHENRQPYLTVNFCIALTGIYPSRN